VRYCQELSTLAPNPIDPKLDNQNLKPQTLNPKPLTLNNNPLTHT